MKKLKKDILTPFFLLHFFNLRGWRKGGVGGREGEREREAGREGGARAKPGNQLVVNKLCG